MKQLTKEQQEQAVELIEKSITDAGDYSNYIESAKAFLQSLKPKYYVCMLTKGEIRYLTNDARLMKDKKLAFEFDNINDARIELQSLNFHYKHEMNFILTE